MKIDTIMSEYTNGFIEVKQLVKLYPNDMDLGKAIRSLTNNIEESVKRSIPPQNQKPVPPKSQSAPY